MPPRVPPTVILLVTPPELGSALTTVPFSTATQRAPAAAATPIGLPPTAIVRITDGAEPTADSGATWSTWLFCLSATHTLPRPAAIGPEAVMSRELTISLDSGSIRVNAAPP